MILYYIRIYYPITFICIQFIKKIETLFIYGILYLYANLQMERILKNIVVYDIIKYVIMKYHKYYKKFKTVSMMMKDGKVKYDYICYDNKNKLLYLIYNDLSYTLPTFHSIYDLETNKHLGTQKRSHKEHKNLLHVVDNIMMFYASDEYIYHQKIFLEENEFNKLNTISIIKLGGFEWTTFFDESYVYVYSDDRPSIDLYMLQGNYYNRLIISKTMEDGRSDVLYTSTNYIYIIYYESFEIEIYSKISLKRINTLNFEKYVNKGAFNNVLMNNDLLYTTYKQKSIVIYNALTLEKLYRINTNNKIYKLSLSNYTLLYANLLSKNIHMYSIY